MLLLLLLLLLAVVLVNGAGSVTPVMTEDVQKKIPPSNNGATLSEDAIRDVLQAEDNPWALRPLW